MENLIERERLGMTGVEPIFFNDFCDIFLEKNFQNKSEKYKKNQSYKINIFKPHFENKLMTQVEAADITRFREWREAQGVTSKTLRDDLCLLHLIFKAAIKNDYATTNPVDGSDLPSGDPENPRSAIQDEILLRDLRQINGLPLYVILLLRNTGLRLGELFRLTWDDIDFENHLIRVSPVKTTKAKILRHTIMTPTTAGVLNLIGRTEGHIFTTKQRAFEDRIYNLKSKHKWGWDNHSLRHSFITKLRNANVPEMVVRYYVGHSTKKSQTDRYTSYTKDFVDASIQAADFGSEILSFGENVVTTWTPRFQEHNKINSLSVPGTGLEPVLPNKINNLADSANNPKNKKIWRKS